MRYLTYYKEYPIYEPAEGGYYYAGNEVAKSERMSKRKCRSCFNEIWKECEKENIENGFTEDVDWAEVHNRTGIHPWIKFDDNYICRESNYVGQGESYVIERKLGSQRKGWEPYC